MSEEQILTPSEPSEPSAPPTLDDTLSRVADEVFAREPVRGSNGQFQPKVVASDAPAATEVPGTSGTAPPAPQPEVIEAPQSLPADVKAKWSVLPPDVQKFWSSRESEIHQKITTDGQRLKDYEALEAGLDVAKSFLEQNRIPKAEYIRRLAAADEALRTRPQEAMAEIARMYGIPLGNQPGAQPDPNSALTKQVADLQSKLAQLEQANTNARLADAQQRIDEFKKDRPYFDRVEDLMDRLIQSKAAKGLEDAYDMAVNAHPEVRAQREADAKAAADKKAADEAKEKAAKDAKLAPLSKRPGSVQTAPVKGKNWEDTMNRVADEVYARG